MFRMGGAAEGITSGLDKPKRGLVDEPGKYSQDDPQDRAFKTDINAAIDASQAANDPRVQRALFSSPGGFSPGSAGGFLTSFGLDLLSRPPEGGTLATIASAAKGPFQTFQAANLARGDDRSKFARDLFVDELQGQRDIEEATRKGAGDVRKTPEVEATLIKQAQTNIFDARDVLKKEGLTEEERIAAERKIVLNQNVLQKELGVPAEYEAILSSEELFNSYKTSYVETENNKRIKEYKDKNPNATAEQVAENVTLIDVDSPEAADFTIDELNKRYGYAIGGRVGLAMGSESMMPAVAEAPKEQVQDLSYTELRSRLPNEISSDIVQLLSQSKQALLDFANIQTPEDIASFNQQYEVNLTLPQGA